MKPSRVRTAPPSLLARCLAFKASGTDFASVEQAGALFSQAADTNEEVAHRALLKLHSWQTEDEKASHDSKHRNNIGFSMADACTGSRLSELILEGDQLNAAQRNQVINLVTKYRSQLIKHCEEEELREIFGDAEAVSAADEDDDASGDESDDESDEESDESESDDESDGESESEGVPPPAKKHLRVVSEDESSESEEEEETPQKKRRRTPVVSSDDDSESEEKETPKKKRRRAPVVSSDDDSEDEEPDFVTVFEARWATLGKEERERIHSIVCPGGC